MADDTGDAEEPGPFDALREDHFFAPWHREDERPSAQDILAAAWAVLDQTSTSPFSELERERARRKVALLQVVSPYFTDGAPNWESVFERLSPEDREAVEELLGNDSLSELLD